jgi:hypothetical protein
MLAVVVCDVEVDGEYKFARRMFGGNPEQLRALAAWLLEEGVEEVVMESTAQYWRPVWESLEMYWKPICEQRDDSRPGSATLHLAMALANRPRRWTWRELQDGGLELVTVQSSFRWRSKHRRPAAVCGR